MVQSLRDFVLPKETTVCKNADSKYIVIKDIWGLAQTSLVGRWHSGTLKLLFTLLMNYIYTYIYIFLQKNNFIQINVNYLL